MKKYQDRFLDNGFLVVVGAIITTPLLAFCLIWGETVFWIWLAFWFTMLLVSGFVNPDSLYGPNDYYYDEIR